jgi:hypothetical protein
MDASEKEKQILTTTSVGPADEMSMEKETNIFFPEKEAITVGDRKYLIGPLKLKQMKLLLRLSKIDLKSISESSIDAMTDGIAEILKEPDKAFLEENLDVRLIKSIFQIVRDQTYAGIPKGRVGSGNPPEGDR